MKSRCLDNMPPELLSVLNQVGEQLKRARLRRNRSVDWMAAKVQTTAKTYSKIEKGSPEVNIGIYASALFVLGMHKQLLGLAAPEKDEIGIWEERRRGPKRARVQKSSLPSLDF